MATWDFETTHYFHQITGDIESGGEIVSNTNGLLANPIPLPNEDVLGDGNCPGHVLNPLASSSATSIPDFPTAAYPTDNLICNPLPSSDVDVVPQSTLRFGLLLAPDFLPGGNLTTVTGDVNNNAAGFDVNVAPQPNSLFNSPLAVDLTGHHLTCNVIDIHSAAFDLNAVPQPALGFDPPLASNFTTGGYFTGNVINNHLAAFDANYFNTIPPASGVGQLLNPRTTLLPASTNTENNHGVAPNLPNGLHCLCGKKFSRKDSLTRHIRTASRRRHTEVLLVTTDAPELSHPGQNACTLCNKYRGARSFLRRDHLRQHLRGYHKMDKEAIDKYCHDHSPAH
ncbi:hypothetical protein V8F20_001210 [Naviculisporaceae sp. PSN 640]